MTEETLKQWKKVQAEMDEVLKKAKEARQPEIDKLVEAKKEIDAKIEVIRFSILAEVFQWFEERNKGQVVKEE